MEQQKQQVAVDNKTPPAPQTQKVEEHKGHEKDGNKQANPASGIPPLAKEPNASTGASAPKTQ